MSLFYIGQLILASRVHQTGKDNYWTVHFNLDINEIC